MEYSVEYVVLGKFRILLRLCLLAALLPAMLTAQHALLQATDATSIGLAGAGVAREGISALWLNPAGLAEASPFSFGASVLQPYGISELNIVTGGMVYSGFGLQLASLRVSDYHASRFGLAYGRSLGERWRIGGELMVFRQRIRNYAPVSSLVPGLGVAFSPVDELCIAARLLNPTAVGDLPRQATVGGSYTIGDRVSIYVDEVYESVRGLSTRLGISYAPAEVVRLQFGFETQPGQISFGVAYRLGQPLSVVASGSQHPALGLSGGAGFTFQQPR